MNKLFEPLKDFIGKRYDSFKVEDAFIVYDRYTGRHRGFGFVTFADMTTTKLVCPTRVFNLHGRKIECKRALKREDTLAGNEGDSNNYKSFRPNNNCSSTTPLPPPTTSANLPSCIPSIPYPSEHYRRSSPPMINPLNESIVNLSIPQLIPISK